MHGAYRLIQPGAVERLTEFVPGAWVVEVLTLLPQRGEGLSILAHFMPRVPGAGCMVPGANRCLN